MTISYGIAQILAPVMTGIFAGLNISYLSGLYMSSIALVCGTLLMFKLKCIEKSEQKLVGGHYCKST